MKKSLLALLLATATPLFAGEWLTDYDKAFAQAKAENKQLLLDFTGSDWCGWCMKLDREVFEQPEFKEYADRNLVLLKVDFPRRKPQPASEKAQNEKLAEKYRIEGYPTLVVLNPDEKKAGELGYVPGGPKAFIDELQKRAPKP
jgi:protein disulfide-isomerase